MRLTYASMPGNSPTPTSKCDDGSTMSVVRHLISTRLPTALARSIRISFVDDELAEAFEREFAGPEV